MELLIFWLPIIGGILLGGFCVGALYAGRATQALWFGVFGFIFFIFVGAIQIQKEIWRRDTADVVPVANNTGVDRPILFVEFMDSITADSDAVRLNVYNWAHSSSPWIQQKIRFRNHGRTPAVIASLKCGAIVSAVAPDQNIINGADDVDIPTEIVITSNERSEPFTSGPRVRWLPFLNSPN